MSARTIDGPGNTGLDDTELGGDRAGRRPAKSVREPGLDLTCTKVAVDFQSISLNTADQRIRAGLQSLVDVCGADSVFVALVDAEAHAIHKVFAGRSTFSACNPEVLVGVELGDFPWIKSRLEHLRLLEIRDTAKAPLAQARDAERLASLNVGALLVVGFDI